MKIILTNAVKGLGRPGDAVEVAPGYARNYLIPRGLAEQATPSKMKEWEFRRIKIEKKLAEERAGAEEIAGKLAARQVVIQARSGEEGKLFGSVTNKDVAEAVAEQLGVEIDRRKYDMEQPIKAVGEYTVEVDIHPDVTANVRVKVASSGVEVSHVEEAAEEAAAVETSAAVESVAEEAAAEEPEATASGEEASEGSSS